MTLSLAGKPSLLLTSGLLSLLACLALLGCRPGPTASAAELGLVWEAWGHIKGSYVGGETLDSKQVAGSMITRMLDASGKPTYPFLTELDDVGGRTPGDVPTGLADVWKAWALFGEKWPEVDRELLANAAVEGMLDGLGDRSAAHLTGEAYARAQESLRGTYEGIGAFVGVQDGKIVLSPMPDSPAQRAELQAGDVLLGVNGDSVGEKRLQEVVEHVRGPAGTKVTLLIEREGEEGPLEFSVVRGDVGMMSVDRRLYPGAIGHINISDFTENTPDQLLDALEDLQRLDMLALILDLRSNPGGSIESASKVASQFLSGGLFMYEIDRGGQRRDWHIEEAEIDVGEIPMVVLVNELTGSAAEAVAGALQDTERAKVLGMRTVGKGSANVYKELSDGSAIYIAVSFWYTPLGRLLEGTGIEPDIEVAISPEDQFAGIDSQLRDAYQYLDGLLPRFR